jgi:hypothetical protein
MHPQPYPTATTSPPATEQPPPAALHLLHRVWVASCPSCGFQLATARTQHRCERRAARRACPVCYQDGG